MLQHDDEGAMGVVLNRPTQTAVAEAWDQVSDTDCEIHDPLFCGGPCQQMLTVLHTHEFVSEINAFSGMYYSSDKDSVEWLVEHGDGPMKFFVGCAGWSPDQLEGELATDSWLTMPAKKEHIFYADDDLWQRVNKELALTGLDPRLIPKDPSMN